MTGRTKVLSAHKFRRVARREERRLTESLAEAVQHYRGYEWPAEHGAPSWAHGFRVEKAGLFQWAVVATEHAGR